MIPPLAVRAALADTQTEWGASRFAEWQRCQQAHSLRYVKDIEPKRYEDPDFGESGGEPVYFSIGRLLHACRAYVQNGHGDWHEVLDAARLGWEGQAPCDIAAVYEVERLLSAYDAYYGTSNAGWPDGVRIVNVEVELKHERLGVLPYTARADAIADVRGSCVIIDIKTRGSKLPDNYAEHAALRPQFLGLSWLAMTEFKLSAPPPIWVDAIIKTKIPNLSAGW